MKIFFYILLPIIILSSCCLGNRKCNADDNSARFRIVSAINGQDLVFGSSKIYDKNTIKFYSLTGTDTIFHHYGAGPNPNPGQDSLLYVNFDYRKKETVFVLLNNADIDTLNLTYETIDGSPCCPDHMDVKPSRYNSNLLQTISGGITIIKK
ncbi:MAG: hypothetical protein AAB221_10725 [Bacteroidota bacterium]